MASSHSSPVINAANTGPGFVGASQPGDAFDRPVESSHASLLYLQSNQWDFIYVRSEYEEVDDEGPPAKRLKLSTYVKDILLFDEEEGIENLPPIPSTFWPSLPTLPSDCHTCPTERSPVENVQTAPYRVEAPPDAPAFNGGNADFSPWTGRQSEDVMDEHTVNYGNYDRIPDPEDLSNSARPVLYEQFKEKFGLDMLSSVLHAALQRRQDHNTISTSSTFRPPPRVTLTDHRREAWLLDLANSEVPLRRLSRMIPHGIRGKILLDQCMEKEVPLGRATWLAKCVGCNEIRAFQRRGIIGAVAAGLEVKWVRDWTANVEQLLEETIIACGFPNWHTRFIYAISLTTHLLFECLLDHGHYVNWLLSSLESSDDSLFPTWVLLLNIHWRDVLRYRKQGTRLAELLLERKPQLSKYHDESHKALHDYISSMIRRLVLEDASSAVLPNSWNTHKGTLVSCLNLDNEMDDAIYRTLAFRNMRVQQPVDRRTVTAQCSQRFIRLLDHVHSNFNINSTSVACLNTVKDKGSLVFGLLEWTATPLRHGISRVFTGVQLLRKWKVSAVDIDEHISAFLSRVQSNKLVMNNVYHVISELVRHENFSVGRYLQWLVAKGTVDGLQTAEGTTMPSEVELLAHIPVGYLPEYLRNFRNMLMAKAGLPTQEEEDSMIQLAKNSIVHRIPRLFGPKRIGAVSEKLSNLNLTWSVKSEIGKWIRYRFAGHYCSVTRMTVSGTLHTTDIPALSVHELYETRDILEGLGDIPTLAELLLHASNSNNQVVLAASADTALFHVESFLAIGVAMNMFHSFFHSYLRLKAAGIACLDLLVCLRSICLRIPFLAGTVVNLEQELDDMGKSYAVARTSWEPFERPGLSIYKKVDALFLSDSTIDESIFEWIVSALTRHVECGDSQGRISAADTCRYLAHLKTVYPAQFGTFITRWFTNVLKSSGRPALLKILPPLVGAGCAGFQELLLLVRNVSKTHAEVASAIPDMLVLQAEILEVLVPIKPVQNKCFDLISYRFRLIQKDYLLKDCEEALRVISDAATILYNELNQDSVCESRRNGIERNLVTLFSEMLVGNPRHMYALCMHRIHHQHSAVTAALQRALDNLLGFNLRDDLNSKRAEAQAVICEANELSLPFCQLKLQILFEAESDEGVRNSIVDVLFENAFVNTLAKCYGWVDLVVMLSQNAVQQVRERAEKGFFSISMEESFFDDQQFTARETPMLLEKARAYLYVIEVLSHSIPETGMLSITPNLVERLDLLLQKFVAYSTSVNSSESIISVRPPPAVDNIHENPVAVQARPAFETALAFWPHALLRIIVFYRSAFNASLRLSTQTSQWLTRLLACIFDLAISRYPSNFLRVFPIADYFPHLREVGHLRPFPSVLLITQALDVAASLIDVLPDEIRLHCGRCVKERFPHFVDDPRFMYLFGPLTTDTTPVKAFVNCNENTGQNSFVASPTASNSTPIMTPPSSQAPVGSSAPQQQQQSTVPSPSLVGGLSEARNHPAGHLRVYYREGETLQPHPIRPWELIQSAAPRIGLNDTAIGLEHFDARRVRE